ncbi:MAG TPA: glyoxalase, partial [Thalassospira sp.]|nr:glyoxalase [Thalassospira sp.]
ATEAKIKADGIETFNHADYEPGRRFYFRDENDIEFEVVSYA